MVTAFNVAAGSFPDPTTALSSLQTSFSSNENNDGFAPLSVSMNVVGFSTATTTTSGVNLGLILGLSIPLTILLILIIVILAMRSKEDIIDTAEREDAAETVDQV